MSFSKTQKRFGINVNSDHVSFCYDRSCRISERPEQSQATLTVCSVVDTTTKMDDTKAYFPYQSVIFLFLYFYHNQNWILQQITFRLQRPGAVIVLTQSNFLSSLNWINWHGNYHGSIYMNWSDMVSCVCASWMAIRMTTFMSNITRFWSISFMRYNGWLIHSFWLVTSNHIHAGVHCGDYNVSLHMIMPTRLLLQLPPHVFLICYSIHIFSVTMSCFLIW